jgi:hypothetical protein
MTSNSFLIGDDDDDTPFLDLYAKDETEQTWMQQMDE